jgi:UDP-N-acetylmuramoyl-L-alanyl-D-glutamate--2,6-diaminopimelate ligase
MLLGELTQGLGITLLTPGAAAVRITDVTEDSRTALPGSLFIARSGRQADGRQYVLDAVAAGATAILTDDPEPLRTGNACPAAAIASTKDIMLAAAQVAERFYGNPARVLASRAGILGVTGTNGKTTITWLTWQILNRASIRCGLIGTVVIDDGREVAAATMTTPPAVELSLTLANMVEAGCQAVVLEASSHALHQRRVGALPFRVGIFTNLTQDHLDYHGTMEHYAAAKAMLFAALGPDGVAIVNADDPAHARMIAETEARVIRCRKVDSNPAGGADQAQVRIVSTSMRGMKLELAGPFGNVTVLASLIGSYNAMNILQAAVAAHALGVPTDALSESLAQITAPPGRLELVATDSDEIAVYVDYAHTDDGLRSMLTAVRSAMDSGELWVVFGCGGDRDKGKRPKMGRAASDLGHRVVVTSDNPRTERTGEIISQIMEGIPEPKRSEVVVHADRAKAIEYAISAAKPGDVVVIAGKGHEAEQILPDGNGGTYRIKFDDREHAASALASRRGVVTEVKELANRGTAAANEDSDDVLDL